MHYSGYAYTETEDEQVKTITERFEDIRHLAREIRMARNPQYAHTDFRGQLETKEEKELTEMDVLILADSGNLCFGGCCKINDDGTFFGHYNTD